jgi:hypothetical protein
MRSGIMDQRLGSKLYHVRDTVWAIFREDLDARLQTSAVGRGMNGIIQQDQRCEIDLKRAVASHRCWTALYIG